MWHPTDAQRKIDSISLLDIGLRYHTNVCTMNLFILSLNVQECAEAMFDKHVAKIILEAVQMLCTTMHLVDPDNEVYQHTTLYKIAHKNHPVTVWMRQSLDNYLWTLDLVDAMHQEWRQRYRHPPTKFHKSYEVAQFLRRFAPEAGRFPTTGLTPFALAMPQEYKRDDPVESYRLYYQSPEKQKLAAWKGRDPPSWWNVPVAV